MRSLLVLLGSWRTPRDPSLRHLRRQVKRELRVIWAEAGTPAELLFRRSDEFRDRLVALGAAAAPALTATLTGRVKEYKRKAYTFDDSDQVNEYMVEIWVAVGLRKKGDTIAVWDAPNMRGFGIYSADSAETQGQTRAIEKITEDVINRTIKSW